VRRVNEQTLKLLSAKGTAMTKRYLAYRNNLLLTIFLIFAFFQLCWMLAKASDELFSNYAFDFLGLAIVTFVIPCLLLFWPVKQVRQNKLPLKNTISARIICYAELGVGIACFTLFSLAVGTMSFFDLSNPSLSVDYNQRHIIHPYLGLATGFYWVAFALFFVLFILIWALFPKQVADKQVACTQVKEVNTIR
jgi:hypothetical protein